MRREVIVFIATALLAIRCSNQSESDVFKNPYLGQTPPDTVPEIFAPGIVSSEHQEHSSLAFSPDGKEMWWSRWRLPHDLDRYPQVILFIKYENGRWTQPKVARFSGKHRDGGPAFSPDGDRIFFYSRRPLDEDSEAMHDNDIWFVERTEDGWSPGPQVPRSCRHCSGRHLPSSRA